MKNFATVLVLTILSAYIKAGADYLVTGYPNLHWMFQTNIHEYVHYIETAQNNGVQIIVFPEYGLTGMVEDPTEYAIEIPEVNSGNRFDNYWLHLLSTAAYEHTMYVVVNLLEKANNENNETVYYNTNIVFDKTGTIVAKYRKINLFFEPRLTPGNESVTFATDFGITFGLLTCFDILYYNPSRKILVDSFATDVIYPAAWTSTLPFYHSLTIHSGYSLGNGVNLLASNLNIPSRGISGTGIYGHDGTVLSYYLSGTTSSRMLIGSLTPRGVPRAAEETETPTFQTRGFNILGNETETHDLRNFVTARDFNTRNYQFQDLELTNANTLQTVCHGSFCCNFNVSLSDISSSGYYKFLVYNGLANLGGSDSSIKVCTIIACETSDSSTCGNRNISLSTRFSAISVTGDFEKNRR
ncbi:hypothetical protein NQ318_013084 [Aromia moschata]|uniref:CN hydrolase domain-containing protein n=1 Tax=Aromia moschata TaxID=1265417 RepID=A0AAV8Y0Q1_9CUCU|nr:hypothetical protein NQ318_013084 [Aromia moschata]